MSRRRPLPNPKNYNLNPKNLPEARATLKAMHDAIKRLVEELETLRNSTSPNNPGL